MSVLGVLGDQIDLLSARFDGGERSVGLARAMEDALTHGYATVLQVDSRVRRLERRRSQLAAGGGADSDELAELDQRREELECAAATARRTLAALRDRFVRLGGAAATERSSDRQTSTSPFRMA